MHSMFTLVNDNPHDAIHAAEAAGTIPFWDADIHINPATFLEELHY